MPQPLKNQYRDARARWKLLTLYQKFEHAVILVLTLLIAIVVALAVWNLMLKILFSIVTSRGFDPSDYAVFQALFGMIFTVIIALEFKRSLLVVAERRQSIVQVRTVILLALLAIVRKLIILDLATTEAMHLFALAAAILALGVVYWLIRDQDRRERAESAKNNAHQGG
ncbi:MAG: protein PsiE [Hyphomicrobiaceae bacterium]|nr:MAG: protein PsiE [Hyphomicrobiaceae bacterium]